MSIIFVYLLLLEDCNTYGQLHGAQRSPRTKPSILDCKFFILRRFPLLRARLRGLKKVLTLVGNFEIFPPKSSTYLISKSWFKKRMSYLEPEQTPVAFWRPTEPFVSTGESHWVLLIPFEPQLGAHALSPLVPSVLNAIRIRRKYEFVLRQPWV